jgi:beta-lactamase regulating signal transducer with metallopeptidase domain
MIELSRLIENCPSALLDSSLKALAFWLCANLVLAAGRVKSPALRHAVWGNVLCGMLALPLLSVVLPAIVLPLLPGAPGKARVGTNESSWATPSSASAPSVDGHRAVSGVAPGESEAGAKRNAPPQLVKRAIPTAGLRFGWPAVIAGVYVVGVVALFGRLLFGLVGCRRLVRGGRALDLVHLLSGCSAALGAALRRYRLLVLVCPAVRTPVTVGCLRSRILLPGDWSDWSDSKREAALAHELAHVERRDSLFAALAALNQCLYWFHPLAWLLPRRLAWHSEQACDDRAITLTGAPIPYARHLLEFAGSMVGQRRRVMLGVLSMSDGGDLRARIDAILDRSRALSAPLARGARLLLLALALVVVPAIAALRVGPRALVHAGTPAQNQSQPPSGDSKAKHVTLKVRVLDPQGTPRAGAKLYVVFYDSKHGYTSPLEKGSTGPDGRFVLTIAESDFRETYKNPLAFIRVAAAAEGLGFVWSDSTENARPGENSKASERAELTLRLVADVPIEGRVLDLQGKPVAGAKVRLYDLRICSGEGLGPVIAAARKGQPLMGNRGFVDGWDVPAPGQPAEVASGADGRFRMAGLGRERVVRLEIEGPSIAHELEWAITRAPEAVGAPMRDPLSQHQIYPATFDYLAQPSRRIQGTIRDGLTGNPVPDVTIHGYSFSRSTSDAAGRFELEGYPKSREYSLEILPPSGAPFLAMNLPLDDTPGLEPITADVKLLRGIPVQGRVLDAATGQPVKGSVEYHPLFPNSFIDHHFSRSQAPHSRTREPRADGSFTLTVLPGPGVVLFQAYGGPYESYAPRVGGRALISSISTYTYDYFQSYLPATVDRNELKKLVKDAPFVEQSDFLQLAAGGGSIRPLLLRNYNVAALIDPAADAKGLNLDLSPRRGRTLEAVDPR